VDSAGEWHPWQPLAGTWKEHPEIAEFEQHLRDYRQQVNADPDRLRRSMFWTPTVFILYRHGHASVTRRVEAVPEEQLAITIITIEEQLNGWYTPDPPGPRR
jgi:hypothetical protein